MADDCESWVDFRVARNGFRSPSTSRPAAATPWFSFEGETPQTAQPPIVNQNDPFGFSVGYGIGNIPVGGCAIHEHLGNGIYWVGNGIYSGGQEIANGASAAWNWMTTW